MSLAADIAALRDRALADLVAAHDYHADTELAWRLVRRLIAQGETFSIRSSTTATITTHADLVSRSRGYVSGQLAEATFQQFISIFENFSRNRYPANLQTRRIGSATMGKPMEIYWRGTWLMFGPIGLLVQMLPSVDFETRTRLPTS